MKKSFVLFAALAALFSCTKETPVSPETPSQETYSVTLTAVAPTAGDDTKTTLVEGGKFVHWSKGDAIKVLFFPDCTSHDNYLGPNGVFQSYFTEENSKEAFFRIENWSWKSSEIDTSPGTGKLMDVGIAVYPHTATAVSNKVGGFGSQNAIESEVSFELPAVQNAVKNNIENGLNFSYALISASGLAETINSGGETNLSFKNACAMIELTMPQSFNGKKVTSISVISNDGVALTGKGNVNLGNKNLSSTQNIIPSPFEVIVSGDSGVELSNPEGFEPGQKYYAVVWPGSHPSGLTIQFTAEDGSVASKTTQSVDFAASRVRPYVFKNALEFKAGIPEGATYIYSDGTGGTDPNPSGKTVIAVVIYNGNPKELMNDTMLPDEYCHGLAISITSRQCAWHSTQLSSSSIPSSLKYTTTSTIKDFSKGGYTTMQEYAGTSYVVYDNGEAPSNTSGWYLGTPMEWNYILKNKDQINDLLSSVGGDIIDPQGKSTSFWLPLFYGSKPVVVYLSAGQPYYYYEDWYYIPQNSTYCHYARPIFAF